MHLPIVFNLIQTIATGQSFIDPTGTYKLDSKTKTKNGDTYGYFGEIRVKLLDSNKVAMSFYICKGAPAYNSGSFVDTLPFYNNTAIYKDKYDTAKSCMVTFEFSKIKIKLQETANYKYGTCWGQGVVASGSYKKLTSDIPIIKDPLVDD